VNVLKGGGLKLQEWTSTEDTAGVDTAGVNKEGVKFCELTTLSIIYWAESNYKSK